MKLKEARVKYLISGTIVMLFAGLVYSWSVFVIPIETEFGWVRSQTSLTFSISMTAFCIGGIIGGILSKRYSPRILLYVSAILVLVGFVFASRITSLLGLYISYGVFVGLGVGICYNSILNSNLSWFPDKQGVISGILLMGFALGGSVFASLAGVLIKMFGWRYTFIFFGISTFIVFLLGSIWSVLPSKEEIEILRNDLALGVDVSGNLSSRQIIKEQSFIAYYLWSVLLSAAGLALISNAAPFASTMTDKVVAAAFVAGLISILNGIGRLIFGFILDILGIRKCIFIISTCFIISGGILILSINMNSFSILTIGFMCMGFSYSGITPTNSAFVRKTYGQKNYATNLSIITTVLLWASFLGPSVAGISYNLSNSYISIAVIVLTFGVLSLACLFFIKENIHTKNLW